MKSKSNFRKKNHSDKEVTHFSPTDMVKCPIILRKKKQGKRDYEYSPYTLRLFAEGNKRHILEGVWRKDSKRHVDTELHMTAIHNSGKFIFSGYADFIMVDDKGLYIEDLKTCNRKAFYHFNNEVGSMREKIQVSCYRLLYYVIYGVIIERGVITKIDRDNALNRISLQVDLWSMEDTERFIEYHPTVKYFTDGISEEKFMKETEKYIKANRWICRYCEEQDDCLINLQLQKEEKDKKNEKSS